MTSAYSFSVNYSPGRLTAISDATDKLVEGFSHDVQYIAQSVSMKNKVDLAVVFSNGRAYSQGLYHTHKQRDAPALPIV